ncbi:MAG TPA: hypothetical protein VHJ17_08285, partial [Thermomonospora sp.]|nr:hypothetical protein [Thermomonospora sp.]
PRPAPSRTTPSPTRTTSAPPVRGRLAVAGCRIPPRARACSFTVTAVGGPVRWSVAGANGVTAVGGGLLTAGRSARVTAVRLGPCLGEGGIGSVSLSPNGTAVVTWLCPADEPPGPGPDPGPTGSPGGD